MGPEYVMDYIKFGADNAPESLQRTEKKTQKEYRQIWHRFLTRLVLYHQNIYEKLHHLVTD